MFGNSAPVSSNQPDVHPDLAAVVRAHLHAPWRAPAHAPSRNACLAWLEKTTPGAQPLILDSGCGTGESTRQLALRHPDARVLGVDQSAARLGPGAETGIRIADNAWLLRARAEDTWRVLHEHGLVVDRHYLLYPNPWPKSGHLRRRWHGHPAFALLLAMSRGLELRTNWSIYAREFCLALGMAGWNSDGPAPFAPEAALSPFEAKYQASGHVLFRVCGQARDPGSA